MNKREAKIEALQIIHHQVQAAIDSGAAHYGVSAQDGKKVEREMERILSQLHKRIARLVRA